MERLFFFGGDRAARSILTSVCVWGRNKCIDRRSVESGQGAGELMVK